MASPSTMDIRRKLSSRLVVGVGSGAMAHRIEGSKVVLNTLEKTMKDEEIGFLKPVAETAIAILSAMRVRDALLISPQTSRAE